VTLLTVYAHEDTLSAMPVPSLTVVLVIFLAGFSLHRHRTVLIGIFCALALGVMLANGWVGAVVHTLDRVFTTITT
jgi:hypothetical protein